MGFLCLQDALMQASSRASLDAVPHVKHCLSLAHFLSTTFFNEELRLFIWLNYISITHNLNHHCFINPSCSSFVFFNSSFLFFLILPFSFLNLNLKWGHLCCWPRNGVPCTQDILKCSLLLAQRWTSLHSALRQSLGDGALVRGQEVASTQSNSIARLSAQTTRMSQHQSHKSELNVVQKNSQQQ